jgi:superfamily II DNA or RNA helicase
MPLHYRASYWIGNGVFDELKSFADFEARVNAVEAEKDRGDIFEIFIEGYLATQSITQRVQHWVVGNIPLEMRERYNLPPDGTGIDGIYETHDGSQIAYQVKYRKNHNLTYAEVAPFLGITEKFADRVIFTNATSLSNKALVRTRWFSGDIFNELSEPHLKQIEAWLKQKPIPTIRATPDPNYQVQALADIDAAFKTHNRATVVMACGTGKTLVALWAAEEAKPKTVLVLLPSLSLLQQTLKEWSEQTSWGEKFSYLCVCSDKTVNLQNDDINIDKSEVGFRVDTDPLIVRQFLERQTEDIKVIFSTYHSTEVVSEGSKDLAPFDLGIFDEAHKTTGRGNTIFSYALSDEKVRINKRLFLTATPRHIDIRKRDRDGEFSVQSMDDENIYGPRAHVLSFAAAAKRGIICPYKVIISLIDKKMVDDFTRTNGITLVEGDEIGARRVANLIALEQATKKVDAKKIISFHSRVALAQEFATREPRGIGHYLTDYDVRHVNGSQKSGERSQIINAFANSNKSIITNARCLTEGVNIPAVDMVAFIDPRQSRVDIAQAVGRAMRKPRGPSEKQVGYVLVPLFAGIAGESLEEAIKTEKFDAVADVLNALQEHDEELVDIIRELKQEKGEGKTLNPERLFEKVEFIGPGVGFNDLLQSISVTITDRLGAGWYESYGRLVAYKEINGDCLVSQKYITADGYRLGSWVTIQRSSQALISDDRRHRLDELGFVWDPLTEQWEEGFRALKQYKENYGDCLVPNAYTSQNGYRLGFWVATQRAYVGKLSDDRRRRLDELAFVWGARSEQWEEGFRALKQYKENNGDCLVPGPHKTENGYRLGQWVSVQRAYVGKLSDDRRERLDELGFVWDLLTEQWEEGFRALKQYKENYGDCLVPKAYTSQNGYRLGIWVGNQRRRKFALSKDCLSRLNKLDFVWDTLIEQWEKGFRALKQYKENYGDCLVPRPHKTENGYKLGKWVDGQRRKQSELSDVRRRRLRKLGFVWDPYNGQWEDGFSALKQYKKMKGDCLVPVKYISENGYGLGRWVNRQRCNQSELSEDRIQRLEKLGFVWNVMSEQWEAGFRALKKYKQAMGDCLVPTAHVTKDGYRLGQWVGVQRVSQAKLSKDRRSRLDELRFVWDTRRR